jgi:hypothetical protein
MSVARRLDVFLRRRGDEGRIGCSAESSEHFDVLVVRAGAGVSVPLVAQTDTPQGLRATRRDGHDSKWRNHAKLVALASVGSRLLPCRPLSHAWTTGSIC